MLVWVFVAHTEIVRLAGGFVNDGGCCLVAVGVGEKGGIFEDFLDRDRVKFSTKFSAIRGIFYDK